MAPREVVIETYLYPDIHAVRFSSIINTLEFTKIKATGARRTHVQRAPVALASPPRKERQRAIFL